MSNISDELLKTIKYAIDRKAVNCDRTYRTVIKRIDKNGYVITDRSGQERTVSCCIPNIELRLMQSVWVKEPMGRLNDIHICGVIGNTGKQTRSGNRRR